MACVSRMRPPVPVSAPGYGATPEGKLCVSAVRRRSRSASFFTIADGPPALAGRSGVLTKPRMADELSLNWITLLCARSPSMVSFTILNNVLSIFCPSTVSSPEKNQ